MTNFKPLTKQDFIHYDAESDSVYFGRASDPEQRSYEEELFFADKVHSAVKGLKLAMADELVNELTMKTDDIIGYLDLVDKWFPVFNKESNSQPSSENVAAVDNRAVENDGSTRCGDAGELSVAKASDGVAGFYPQDVKHAARKGCTCARCSHLMRWTFSKDECHKIMADAGINLGMAPEGGDLHMICINLIDATSVALEKRLRDSGVLEHLTTHCLCTKRCGNESH